MRRDLARRLAALEQAAAETCTVDPAVLALTDEELEAEALRILGDDVIETPAGMKSFREADGVSRMQHVRQVLKAMQ